MSGDAPRRVDAGHWAVAADLVDLLRAVDGTGPAPYELPPDMAHLSAMLILLAHAVCNTSGGPNGCGLVADLVAMWERNYPAPELSMSQLDEPGSDGAPVFGD